MKQLTALLIFLTMIFTGCDQASGPGRPVTAYIGPYVTKVAISHTIQGKTTQWIAEGDAVDSLRDWAAALEYKLLEVEDGQTPGDSDGGEVYDFVLTEGGYPGFSYVINGTDDGYLLIEGYWFSVRNPSTPPVTEPHEEKLTLAAVKQLAKKGDALSWVDFEPYPHKDIGSGLYIYCYDIDEHYCLVIGGASTQAAPMYIRLVFRADSSESISDGAYIDIRTENIEDFLQTSKAAA